MQQRLFTTAAIDLGAGHRYAVYWVRIRISGYTPPRVYRYLSRRCAAFSLTLSNTAIPDTETEALYAAYYAHVSQHFDTADTASEVLLGTAQQSYFPTRQWKLREAGGRLIGAGFFDEGVESSAGILNFYHPDYARLSLGKWLYFETILEAWRAGKQWFYPGYIAPGYSRFDYKLEAGTEWIEVWDAQRQCWLPYAVWAAQREEGEG